MSLYARIMARGEYPHRAFRVVPPPEPPPGMIALLFPPAPRREEAPRLDPDTLPDPYGLDPVVFGSEPRVGAG